MPLSLLLKTNEYYEALTAVKDAILAMAGGCTAYAGLSGLHTWRRQLQGGVKFDVARGLAKATYKVRDALWAVRAPATWGSDYPEDYRNKVAHTAEEKGDAFRYVYNKLLEGLTAALQDFDIQTLEGEALWGAEVRKATDRLRACAWELNAAIQAYIDDCAIRGARIPPRNQKEDLGALGSAGKSTH